MSDGAGALDGWLDRLRAEYWEQLGAPPVAESCGLSQVLFRVAERRFAVEAVLCKGVVRRPRGVRLPGVPPWVLGVVGVRGEVVSLTDPAVYLGVPGARPPGVGYVLLLAAEGVKAGLWVDRVADVVEIPEAEVLPVESPWPGCPPGLLRGQWSSGEPPALLLDGRRYVAGTAVRCGGSR